MKKYVSVLTIVALLSCLMIKSSDMLEQNTPTQPAQPSGWRTYVPSWHFAPAIGAGAAYLLSTPAYLFFHDKYADSSFNSYQEYMFSKLRDTFGWRTLGSYSLAPLLAALGYAVKNKQYSSYIPGLLAYLAPRVFAFIKLLPGLDRSSFIKAIGSKIDYSYNTGLILLGAGYLYDVYQSEQKKKELEQAALLEAVAR